ncbi:multidrug MFS transporter [Methylobacillus sp. MM3]|jgi:FlaA1/EpsC-like NDP-sugar epimerase|uniref:polysaccharide biosynthesis protein n=1 Tax=Methylobacillus sp. MM3 TaxID=1848039 RepID=UPI0007DED45B|nr:nucleoside-diphosphate sugar epimerase/dehydratase [Methylobacillus sp. MM3]OAJ71207.1 multidrug MFS transporter [Methylobacillus sp. MM3]
MRRIKNARIVMVFGHDVAVAAFAWSMAFLLRFNFSIPENYVHNMLQTLLWVVPLQALIFWRFGLYRGMWRFASLPDLKRILVAVGISALMVPVVLLMMQQTQVVVPRSVLALDPLLLVLFMGGSRFAYRSWKEHRLYGLMEAQGKPVLIMGAGDAAAMLTKELARNHDWQVVGLLDDQVAFRDRQIHGVRVLGTLEELPEWAQRNGVMHVIIAMPSATHAERRRALDICAAAGIETLTVPSFDDLVSGRVSISQVRRVEVEDLLGRDPVELDDAGLHELIGSEVVMVTGAGGSIGSELCRQIARYQPEMLVLFELNEYALYRLEQEFRETLPQLRIVCVIGDVKNASRVSGVLHRYRPSVVFHAAAYKHVPLMEWGNVSEALANNVVGTHTLATACKAAGVEKVVLISTDKAVNPTNVMGASKRLAELVCQGLQDPLGTRFVMVRFGNVLGSSGSVIPKFREQIAKGGPLTVTHPEVTRYFMSIPEASQLVLQAGLMGKGGEIFVLDMGEPIKIAHLAKEMIRLSGFEDGEIKIVYTGLRPGEKLYEELLADDEQSLPTPHAKLRIARARTADAEWVSGLLRWVSAAVAMDEHAVKEDLKLWVEEYAGDVNGIANRPVTAPASVTLH